MKSGSASINDIFAEVDARAIRRKSGLSQQAFADTFGFTVGALRDWEQGRKRPERSARILLSVIHAAPEAVAKTVADAALTKKPNRRA